LCDTCDVCIKCDDISGVDEEGWCHDCECSAWDSEDDEDDPLTINELLDKIRQKKLDLWDSDEVRLSMLSESLKFSNFTLSQLIEHDDEFFNQLKDRFVKEEFYVGDISKDMTPFVYNSLPDDDDDYDLAEELQDLDDNGDPWGECIFDILVSFFLEEPEDSEAKMRFAEIMADDCVVRREFIDLVFKSEWGGNLTKEQQDLLRYGEYGNL